MEFSSANIRANAWFVPARKMLCPPFYSLPPVVSLPAVSPSASFRINEAELSNHSAIGGREREGRVDLLSLDGRD
jgi:hypothetical protein